jgi:hypothetical protein
MPLLSEITDEQGGYRTVLHHAFSTVLHSIDPALGALAVIYDKNQMEASGYAATLADMTTEKVYFTEYYENDSDPPVKWIAGLMYIRSAENGIFFGDA